MKQGVSDALTSTRGRIRSPEDETKSLGLTDSYQGLYKEDVTRSLGLTDSYQGLYKED